MTARRDPDDLIRSYLDDGPSELADRSYDSVRAHIDHTRQRVVIGPWKEPPMSLTRFALVAAAVLVVAVVGINFLPKQSGPGSPTPVPTATATPSPTAAAVPLPTFAVTGDVELQAGSYYDDGTKYTNVQRLTYTLPDGWTLFDPMIYKHRGEPGEVAFTNWVVTHIFEDACHWDAAKLVDAGTTADELTSALSDQTEQSGFAGQAPIDATIGGYAALGAQRIVPAEMDVTKCTNRMLRYWPDPGPDFSGGLCCNAPGNTDVTYSVDVNGRRLVVVARYYPDSTAQDKAELQAAIDSIQIEALPSPEPSSTP